MVYINNPESSLPPGFRFHPTDEELILHYLKRKLTSSPFPSSIIADVDIYKFDPWDLPAKAAFGEKEWYFFSPRDRKYPNGARPNRAAASGYWKATGTDKIILASGNGVSHENIGVKKALVFYKGKPPKGIKTNWIMHEYRLTETPTSSHNSILHKPPIKPRDSPMRLDDWVLCRIYRKSHVSSPTSTATTSDQDLEEQEEEQFVQETLLPILKSPPNTNTLKSQKSSSFSNLLDAMDYSLLSSILSDNQMYQTGLEPTPPMHNPGLIDQNNNGFFINKLPQLNTPSAPNNSNYYNNKRPHSTVVDDVIFHHPSKKQNTINSSTTFTNTSQDPLHYSFLHQSFLNQQLLLSPHLQFQG